MKKRFSRRIWLAMVVLLVLPSLSQAADSVAVDGVGQEYFDTAVASRTLANYLGTELFRGGAASGGWQFTGDGVNDILKTTAGSNSEVLVVTSAATSSLLVDFDHSITALTPGPNTKNTDLLWVLPGAISAGTKLNIDVAAGVTLTGQGTSSAWLVFWLENSGDISITNAGTIDGNTKEVIKVSSDTANLTLNNTGTITTGAATDVLLLSSGTHILNNSGTITGKVTMGAGSDTFLNTGAGVINGAIDLGNGNNTMNFSSTAAAALTSTLTSGNGNDTISITNAGTNNWSPGEIKIGDGTNSLTVTTSSTGSITLGNVTGGAGNDTVVLSGLTNMAGTIALGAGTDSLTVNSQGSWAAPAITFGTGVNTVHLTNSGVLNWNFAGLAGGAGDDIITMAAGLINLTAGVVALA